MKKFLVILATICVLCAALFALSACGDDSEGNSFNNNTNSEPEKDAISFKTLEIDGTNVYGRVSHETTLFSFINEVNLSGKAKYTVSTDIGGVNVIPSKTLELEVGDNTFYITKTIDGDATAVYTVVIHRNALYEVSFDTSGNGAVPTQYVEEGKLATKPAIDFFAPLGCEFIWDFDFTKPITSNVTIKGQIAAKYEMKNFEFTSTATTCEITGLKDKTATKIVIPDYVTSIGNYAFYICTGLTSVTIGNSVTSIGYDAFAYCNSLTSVTIGNGVTSIGERAFYGCTGLTSVVIPDSVTSIDWDAFHNCTGLTSVTIGNGVTSIGGNAFYNCTGLTSVTIGNGVTSIGYHAFYKCTGLTSITIPDSVTSIGSHAFRECTDLTSITIPNSVTSIGEYAFSGCTGLRSIKYRGTSSQWSSISKGSSWNYNTGSYTITSNYTGV